MTDDEFLKHIGVLGMHWGRRKSLSNARNKKSEDFLQKEVLKKKKISQLSNAELKTLTTRLQLEKQYKELNPSEVSKGRKFIVDLLKEIGREMAKDAIKSGIKTAVGSSVKKIRSRNKV